MLEHITECINGSAREVFGVGVKKRKKRGRILPKPIVDLIHEKNDSVRVLRDPPPTMNRVQLDDISGKVSRMKFEVKEKLAGFRYRKKTKLRTRLLLSDPTRKKFWRFLKSQAMAAGTFTALRGADGGMVFEQPALEETVVGHFQKVFSGSRNPVFPPGEGYNEIKSDGNTECSTDPIKFEEQICCPYSFCELKDVLQALPNGKASGIDR